MGNHGWIKVTDPTGQQHTTTSIILQWMEGTIPITFFNVPGAQHDSTVCELGGIYEKLEGVYNETGGNVIIYKDAAEALCKLSQKNYKFTKKSQIHKKITIYLHIYEIRVCEFTNL